MNADIDLNVIRKNDRLIDGFLVHKFKGENIKKKLRGHIASSEVLQVWFNSIK